MEAESKKAGRYLCRDTISTSIAVLLVIPLTVGAVAAAAVLALLESDLGRAHCWMICCEYERYSLGVEMSP